MAIKKIRERIHNGGTTGTESDWDTYYYETSEDMLVGQVQQLGDFGYRVLSGGLILVWGTVVVQNSGYLATGSVKYPVTVKKSGFPVFGVYDSTGQVFVNAKNKTTTGFDYEIKALALANGSYGGIGAVRVNYHVICEI